MDKILNDYLDRFEKHLRPMAAAQRLDIAQELKSQILEMEHSGVSPQAILERLGPAKDLAKAYLGDSIAKTRGWQRISALIAFYSLAGLSGIFLLPITSISGIAFMLTGLLCPITGIVKYLAFLRGIDLPQIGIYFDTYTATAGGFLPLSFLIGALCFLLGYLLWKATLLLVRSMSRGKKMLDEKI